MHVFVSERNCEFYVHLSVPSFKMFLVIIYNLFQKITIENNKLEEMELIAGILFFIGLMFWIMFFMYMLCA